MNTGCIVCILLALLFLLCALIFFIGKEKAAFLISGFNSLSKEERQSYDRKRMSKDQGTAFFIWAAIFDTGAILSYVFSQYIAIAAFVLWIIVFFHDVHLDEIRAFGKYKRK